MNIELDWGNLEETVIVWKFKARWTPEQFFNSLAKLGAYCAYKPSVDLIVDMRNSVNTTANLPSLMRNALRQSPPNIRHVVVIAQTAFWSKIYRIAESSGFIKVDIPVTFVENVNQAYELLRVE